MYTMFEEVEKFFSGGLSGIKVFLVLSVLYFVIRLGKLIYSLYLGFKLYVYSQICTRTDLKKKYGKWAVISGSTDGIGLAMAKELGRRGHSLVIIGRNEKKLADVKKALEKEDNVGEVLTVKIDLSDSSIENYEEIMKSIDPHNRDIGILINNAGVANERFLHFVNQDPNFLKTTINVNVLAALYFTRFILPGMIKRGRGLVVNVSSMAGSLPMAYLGAYGPSKSLIDAFSRVLQAEYPSGPVDIVNLTPGGVQTKMLTNMVDNPKPSRTIPSAEDFAKSALNAIPSGVPSIAGTMIHGIQLRISLFANSLGLVPIIFRVIMYFKAKNSYEEDANPPKRE